MSVSDQTRNEVWQGFLDAARPSRYYSTATKAETGTRRTEITRLGAFTARTSR